MDKFDCQIIDVEVTSDKVKGGIAIESSILIGSVKERLSYKIINLEDIMIRNALIDMGWTPPNG